MDTKNITKAILEVMKEIKGIEKDSNIGTGSYAYKGVKDQQVKQIVGRSMQAHGLAIIPTSVEEDTQISEWDETYQGQTKHKQSTFTKVRTKYLLLHESGESLEIAGYGHGVDNQDKGAGKATTYALKYALLYLFMIPTGDIDDTDEVHSNDLPVKPSITSPKPTTAPKETDSYDVTENALCAIHSNPDGSAVALRHFEKNGKEWWSHPTAKGGWCSGTDTKYNREA